MEEKILGILEGGLDQEKLWSLVVLLVAVTLVTYLYNEIRRFLAWRQVKAMPGVEDRAWNRFGTATGCEYGYCVGTRYKRTFWKVWAPDLNMFLPYSIPNSAIPGMGIVSVPTAPEHIPNPEKVVHRTKERGACL